MAVHVTLMVLTLIISTMQVPRLALKTPFRDGTIQDIAKQVPLLL